jgi:hypothetical protein
LAFLGFGVEMIYERWMILDMRRATLRYRDMREINVRRQFFLRFHQFK